MLAGRHLAGEELTLCKVATMLSAPSAAAGCRAFCTSTQAAAWKCQNPGFGLGDRYLARGRRAEAAAALVSWPCKGESANRSSQRSKEPNKPHKAMKDFY